MPVASMQAAQPTQASLKAFCCTEHTVTFTGAYHSLLPLRVSLKATATHAWYVYLSNPPAELGTFWYRSLLVAFIA